MIHFREEVICDAELIRGIFASVLWPFVDCGHSRRAAAARTNVSPSFVINLMMTA